MCTQKPPFDFSEQLYTKYREAFNRYITDKVSSSRAAVAACSACSQTRRWARSDPNSIAGSLQVMPSLREHRDEVLLKELYNRWQNHKLMVRWLSRFFNYLDR